MQPELTLQPMVLPALFAAISLWSGLSIVRAARVRPSGRIALTRGAPRSGLLLLVSQLILAFIALIELASGRISLVSIGVSEELGTASALSIGVIAGGAFYLTIERFGRRLGLWDDAADDAAVRALALIIPRSRSQKPLTAIGVGLLNPITEEFLFRGVLVHHLAFLTGNWPLALGAGFVANAANHAYQGIAVLRFHALYFALAVLLLLSPAGLVGAIGAHFVGDIAPLITARRELAAYRARHSGRSHEGSGERA